MALGLGASTSIGYNLYQGNHEYYAHIAMPIIQKVMDGEQAHNFAIKMAKLNLMPKRKALDDEQILVIFFTYPLCYL